jgi:hypothetical protein
MGEWNEDLIKSIDDQMDAMTRYPEMYGSPLAIELQFVQLIEFKYALQHEMSELPTIHNTKYYKFIRENYPEVKASPLSTWFRVREMMQILNKFRQEVFSNNDAS